MTERWVSTKRHYCDTCRCWLSGHAWNISAHERSEGHKARQEQMLREMHAKERRRKQEEQELKQELSRIERAGRDAFLKKDALQFMDPKALPGVEPSFGVSVSATESRPLDVYSGTLVCGPVPSFTTVASQDSAEIALMTPPSLPLCDTQWIMSVDPVTNKPTYFHPVTGETRSEDPGTLKEKGQPPVLGSVKGRAASCSEDVVVSSLLPSVNIVAEAFREHILAGRQRDDVGPQQNGLSTAAGVAVTSHQSVARGVFTDEGVSSTGLQGATPSTVVAEAVSRALTMRQRQDQNLLLQRQESKSSEGAAVIHRLTNTGFIPCEVYRGAKEGFVFSRGEEGVGYYPDSLRPYYSKLRGQPVAISNKEDSVTPLYGSSDKDTLANAPTNSTTSTPVHTETSLSQKKSNSEQEKAVSLEAAFGAWEEVTADASVVPTIRDTPLALPPANERDAGAAPRLKTRRFRMTPANDVAWAEPPPPTKAEVLSAMKDEASASKVLNEDDLLRRTRPMFFPQRSVSQCGSLGADGTAMQIQGVAPDTVKTEADTTGKPGGLFKKRTAMTQKLTNRLKQHKS